MFSHLAGCYTGPVYFDRQHFGTNRLADGVPKQTRHVIGSLEDVRRIIETHRLAMGHIAAHTLVSAGCDSLALQVREPRARILSLYRFWRAQDEGERSRWGLWGSDLIGQASKQLGAFLATPSIWPAVDNAIARQVCGTTPRRMPDGRPVLEGGIPWPDGTGQSDPGSASSNGVIVRTCSSNAYWK